MLPVNYGGHTAYQNTFVSEFLFLFPTRLEKAKHREKYRCPLANRKKGCLCEYLCSDSKYGRTVHI